MTAWDLVGGDPAPASPDGVRALACRIGGTGDAAGQAYREMEAVAQQTCSTPWRGESAERFEQALGGMPAKLRLMAESYWAVRTVLSTYACTVEDIRARAAQAVTRAELADARRRQSEQAVASASARLAQLQGSIDTARSIETGLRWQYQQDVLSGAPQAAATFERYRSQVQARASLESAATAVDAERSNAQADEQAALDEISRERAVVGGLSDEFDRAALRAAAGIEAALAPDLRNDSFLERLRDTAVDLAEVVLNAPEALRDAVLDAVAWVHRALESLDAVLTVLIIALVVVAIVTVLTGGALAPFIAALAVLLKASAVVSRAKLVTGTILYATRHPDPKTGRVMVKGGDLAVDALGVVLDRLPGTARKILHHQAAMVVRGPGLRAVPDGVVTVRRALSWVTATSVGTTATEVTVGKIDDVAFAAVDVTETVVRPTIWGLADKVLFLRDVPRAADRVRDMVTGDRRLVSGACVR